VALTEPNSLFIIFYKQVALTELKCFYIYYFYKQIAPPGA